MMDLNVPDVPVLSTERFNLVELDEKHAPAVFRLRSSPDVNRYLGRQPAATIEDAVDFIGKIRKATAAKDALYWAVTQKKEDHFVGTAVLMELDATKATAGMGYELLPEWQGRGVMQEVLPIVIQFGFEVMQLKTITAECHAQNARSLKLLKRFGFHQTGAAEDMTHHELSHDAHQALR